jgi:ATP-dependent protease HslVU (ClpYQ) peptidase subunit
VTCIVGLRHRGHVYLGGDSAGVAGMSLTVRADEKVFRTGPYVMGFTTSFRMGQLLRYKLEPPAPTEGLDRFMVTTFVDAVRSCLSDGGWLKKESSKEEGGTFLVGVAGELFAVYSDFQVGRAADEYDAVGCGADLAKGAMHATRGRAARHRLLGALSAAAHHSGGVVEPFTVVRTARPGATS